MHSASQHCSDQVLGKTGYCTLAPNQLVALGTYNYVSQLAFALTPSLPSLSLSLCLCLCLSYSCSCSCSCSLSNANSQSLLPCVQSPPSTHCFFFFSLSPINLEKSLIYVYFYTSIPLPKTLHPAQQATLHQDQLHAKTSVASSSTFTEDRIWLNGIEEPISNKRLQNVLAEIRGK